LCNGANKKTDYCGKEIIGYRAAQAYLPVPIKIRRAVDGGTGYSGGPKFKITGAAMSPEAY
jgi:hypothetical protein